MKIEILGFNKTNDTLEIETKLPDNTMVQYTFKDSIVQELIKRYKDAKDVYEIVSKLPKRVTYQKPDDFDEHFILSLYKDRLPIEFRSLFGTKTIGQIVQEGPFGVKIPDEIMMEWYKKSMPYIFNHNYPNMTLHEAVESMRNAA